MPLGIAEYRGATSRRKRRREIGEPREVPTETGARWLGESWKTRVQDLSDINEGTQSTMEEGVCLARKGALRVEALSLSKLTFISRKRLETLSLGLWRVLILGVRERQASKVLRPGREPHWFEWKRPRVQAMADSLTVDNSSRIFDIVLRRTIVRKEAGKG